MGMSLDATIVYGVVVGEDDPFNEFMEEYEWDLEDGWAASFAELTYDEFYELDFEERQKIRNEYPCPVQMEWAGTDSYSVHVLYIPDSRINAYYDPVKFTLKDLELPPEDFVDNFVAGLKRLGVQDRDCSWLLFPSWL